MKHLPWGRLFAGLFAAASALAGAGVLPPKAAAIAGALGALAAFTPAVHTATPSDRSTSAAPTPEPAP